MYKGRPLSVFPFTLKIAHLVATSAMGLALLYFFLGYQPTLDFPPVKQSVAHAETAEQTQTVQASSFPFAFQLPHPGYLSTPFSTYHPGVDIATGLGMPIKPITKGTVVNTGFSFWGLGLDVEVDHGQGYHSVYGHMGKIYVHVGQQVTENDILGEVGLTGNTSGPHTHLELSKNGSRIDPLPFLPTIRRIPQAQDFIAQGTSASSSARLANAKQIKTYTGGRTTFPQIAPTKQNIKPVATPQPTAKPSIVDQLEASNLLSPIPSAKPIVSLN